MEDMEDMEDMKDMKDMMNEMNEMMSSMTDMMGSGMMGSGMMGVFIFWLVLGIVLIALATTTLIWMIRAIRRQGPAPSSSQPTPHTLDR